MHRIRLSREMIQNYKPGSSYDGAVEGMGGARSNTFRQWNKPILLVSSVHPGWPLCVLNGTAVRIIRATEFEI
jgi:hypothetical protein